MPQLHLADDERALLHAALCETDAPAAWRAAIRARRGGIDDLDGEWLSLLPMVYANVHEADPNAPEIGRLRGVYRRTWYANQMSLHAAAQAVAALQNAGIGTMLLGGCALMVLRGGNAGLRPIGMIELAVAAKDRTPALRALAGVGWARRGGRAGSATAQVVRRWSRVHLTRGRGEQLVVHCAARRPGRDGPEHRIAAITATVGGATVPIPSAADQLFLACLGRDRTNRRHPLRWIPDAALVIRAADAPIDGAHLTARASARGASAELDAALRLLATEFGLEVSAPRASQAAAGPTAPVRTARRLRAERIEAFQRMALDSALATVVPALRARGVRPVLIKGPATARWLYDDPRERPYGDIDLLIAPDCFALAGCAMAEHGFVRVEDALRESEYTTHHERWIRPGTQPVKVELHRTLLPLNAVPPSLVWRQLTAETETVEVGGCPIETPSDPAAALILCLHAGQHGAAEPRPISDLARAVDRVSETTWRRAAALAVELRAGPAFAAGLGLVPAGRDLGRALGLDTTAPPSRPASEESFAVGIETFFRTRGAVARITFLTGRLFPSRAYLRASSPLARRGTFGVAAAYVLRPFQLLRRFPAGLRAWRTPAPRSGVVRPS
jgi:hypothetical protein